MFYQTKSKLIMRHLTILAIFTLIFLGCEKDEKSPQLPPEESMTMDFSAFTNPKSATLVKESPSVTNYTYSALNVAFWNTILYVNMAVPVASFKTAFKHLPVKTAEKTWEWSYRVEGFGNDYLARLSGTIVNDSVEWEMHVQRTGTNPFDEFVWYSGTSANDRSGGYWILNHSHTFQERLLKIEWNRDGSETGEIKYTLIREKNDARAVEKNKGAFIKHGITDDYYNGYYDIHIFDVPDNKFIDVNIKWNRTTKEGKVKSPDFYNDSDWHCWDSNGNDSDCL